MRKSTSIRPALCLLLGLLLTCLPVARAACESGEAGPAITQPAHDYAEVATDKGTLNLRKEPEDGAKVLQRLAKGTIVRVVEDLDGWTAIFCGGETGYVKTEFLRFYDELPFSPITSADKGQAVMKFKRALYQLDYLKSEEINQRWDRALETALIKLQLLNGVPLNTDTVTPVLQAMIEWNMIKKGKSGYVDIATDAASGLTAAIFCWDSASMLYEEDQAVKLQISFGAQAKGGQPPYDITVRKSLSASGGEQNGDIVSSPFSHIWGQSSEVLYIYATVTDAAGSTVTASTPFRYMLPERYTGLG